MVLIGCDFHPSWQQVSWMNRETGEAGDQKLVHEPGAVEKFYQQFPAGTRIGMEATGNCQWFVEMVTGLGHKVLVGDAAKIRASDSRQQKHDKRDARLLVQLLAEDRYLGAFEGTEGSTAAADPSLQAGADPRAGEERAAAPGDEPRRDEEAKAVEQSRRESASRVTACAMGQPAARRPVQGKRDVERAD